MLINMYNQLENHYQEMVSIRRYLHQHPELSFEEKNTAAYIQEYYNKLGIPMEGNIGGNGVVAKIVGAKPGKTVALRADFDALPIQDEKEVPYKSLVPGVMHACGHDGHTATLLVLAKVLNQMRAELEGTYVMIHQHAEELSPGGAKSMIEAGCLDGVDVIFGTHLWATVPTGTIQSRVGPIMAAADRIEITINGRGGHGAQPHRSKDAIVTAAQLVVNLQQIVSRKVNPVESAVVSIGSFIADNAYNVIADKVYLGGTVRTFNEETRSLIEQEMERVIKGTAITNDCSYDYLFKKGYPALVNHQEEAEFILDCAAQVPDVEKSEETPPQMAGEDFSYYLQHVKGAFFFTGASPNGSEEGFSHHHPRFDIDEKAMLIAAKTLGTVAIQYQQK